MTQNKRPIALITGGSRGLGKSMALHLLERGVELVVTYRSHAEGAQEVVEAAAQKDLRAVALQLDTTDVASFGAFAETLKAALSSRFGVERFDHLVNNAGFGVHATFVDTTEEQFDGLMNVHLKGPFFLTQALLPRMNDGGRILNVSTGLARFTLPGFGAYAAMKGAVEVLTRYQAKELGARGITVNVLAPGAIETDFGGGMVRDVPDVNQMVAAQIPLGRAGLPEDIGAVAAALLSDDAGWINGQRIEASGGQLI